MRAARLAAAIAMCAACGGASASRSPPMWEQPGLYGAARPEMGPPQPGDSAPDFELPTPAGSFHLAALRGSWVVLHFTASWCPYCDAEVEHLGELSQTYAARDVKVVLIGVKEEAAHWDEYTKGHTLHSVLVLSDVQGEVARKYAPPRAQPSFPDRSQVVLDSTIVIDPRGEIRLFLFPDSAHFDPTFKAVRGQLDRFLAEGGQHSTLLAPEKVVTVVVTAPPRVEAGGHGDLNVDLRIEPGYHVMSDSPSERTYIATRVRFDDAADVAYQPARYPPPVAFRFADKTIATFQGDALVHIPFDVTAAATPVERVLTGAVRYQACTQGTCLFPVTQPIQARLLITDPAH